MSVARQRRTPHLSGYRHAEIAMEFDDRFGGAEENPPFSTSVACGPAFGVACARQVRVGRGSEEGGRCEGHR